MIAAAGKLTTPVENGGDYDYLSSAGLGVDVYVMDSGIKIDHPKFGGRAKNFKNARSDERSAYCDETYADTRGHGTQ